MLANKTFHIRELHSHSDWNEAYPVVAELRPHLSLAEYLSLIEFQRREGYRAVVAADEQIVLGFAGFRRLTMLHRGPHIYIDDLVTTATSRSQGVGDGLLDWVIDEAKRIGCQALTLDSGVQRFDAHRFYLRKRMRIEGHHFSLAL